MIGCMGKSNLNNMVSQSSIYITFVKRNIQSVNFKERQFPQKSVNCFFRVDLKQSIEGLHLENRITVRKDSRHLSDTNYSPELERMWLTFLEIYAILLLNKHLCCRRFSDEKSVCR